MQHRVSNGPWLWQDEWRIRFEWGRGEGTGAALALPLVEAAARVLDEMATFDHAGVSDASDAPPL